VREAYLGRLEDGERDADRVLWHHERRFNSGPHKKIASRVARFAVTNQPALPKTGCHADSAGDTPEDAGTL
jgi:hypothetical protein